MKKITLVVSVLLLTLSSQAQIVFQNYSQLPTELQTYLQTSLTSRCLMLAQMQVQLTELKTSVRRDKVDQGVIDYYFTTTFVAHKIHNKYPSQYQGEVIVESALFSISNGENRDILSISPAHSLGCH